MLSQLLRKCQRNTSSLFPDSSEDAHEHLVRRRDKNSHAIKNLKMKHVMAPHLEISFSERGRLLNWTAEVADRLRLQVRKVGAISFPKAFYYCRALKFSSKPLRRWSQLQKLRPSPEKSTAELGILVLRDWALNTSNIECFIPMEHRQSYLPGYGRMRRDGNECEHKDACHLHLWFMLSTYNFSIDVWQVTFFR